MKTTIIRDNTSLDDVYLDEIYGRLGTHDLKIQQRNNRKSTRPKFVALNAKAKMVEKFSRSTRRNIKYVESSELEDEANSDENYDDDSDRNLLDTEMKEMVDMIVKGFTKMKYRKIRKSGNTLKKGSDY